MPSPWIDDYSFGRVIIDGQRHTSDLIIGPDGAIRDDWWRASGHNLVPADIADLLEARPGLLIVGTGASGMMRVSAELERECARRGIRLEAARTGDAVQRFNERAAAADSEAAGSGVAACFHLTC